jgi:4-amino-4-deoxy-L-arabinose transferase-like glycosyltransferase
MPNLFAPLRRVFVTTWPSAIVALLAWISIVITIDPAGSYPSMPQGPGLTIDEIFNVEQGVYLVEQTRALAWYNLIPGTSIEAFRRENGYNPDHPPLGRYWLGLHHHLAWWIAPPHEPDGPFVTACARTGSATAFALTVWLIGAYLTFASSSVAAQGDSRASLTSQIQAWAGPLAGLALVLMPRVYGHAHLAALETFTNLTCTAAVLAIAAWWAGPVPPSQRAAMAAGLLMGLAMLSKIQAVLIPFPVIAWALWRWRQKAIVPLALWGLTAIGVFFLGWPYLWLDPMGHFLEYLGRTTNRAVLHCFYLGVRYEDKAVPWHYPFVMFAVTVPLGLHALGLLGLGREKVNESVENTELNTWRVRLLLACGIFPLVIFALPGVAVYDGERLFLTVFPLWAIFVGRGAAREMELAARKLGARFVLIGACVVAGLQFSSNLQIHPSYLSYYNLAVGGVKGAETLGLEMNYWGDSITRSLLEDAVSGEKRFTKIEIRPSLHQYQEEDLLRQSPTLRRAITNTGSGDPLRLAFRRRADLSDEEFLKYEPRSQDVSGMLARRGLRK